MTALAPDLLRHATALDTYGRVVHERVVSACRSICRTDAVVGRCATWFEARPEGEQFPIFQLVGQSLTYDAVAASGLEEDVLAFLIKNTVIEGMDEGTVPARLVHALRDLMGHR